MTVLKTPDKRGAILEGSSRSGKTFSSIDFVIGLCTSPGVHNLVIFIVKETYNSFKTTLYNDFNVRLPHHGMSSPMATTKDVQSFDIFGNKIYFIGADNASKVHGAGCDFFWMNEMLDIDKPFFDHYEMRCRCMWWGDFNPKVSDHWVFDMEKRKNVAFCHSTMIDNPDVPHWQKVKILSYEPTQENIASGTADDYMWSVYGLGLRASPQGLVFPNVVWIDEFPTDIDEIIYGCDFGSSSPTAITKVGRNGNNLYVKLMYYLPTQNARELLEPMQKSIGESHVWCDSADPGMISDLRRMGIKALAVKKFPGSVSYGIGLINGFKLHLVKDTDLRKEQENYKWREINGIRLDEPIKEYDHCFSYDTNILTTGGIKRICDVCADDYVLTSHGINKVLKSFSNGCFEICEYLINFDGKSVTVRCTPNHQFKTDQGWKQIQDIKKGSVIYLSKHSMARCIINTQVKGISQRQIRNYTGLSGNITTAQSRKAGTFIMQTMIRLITGLRILSWSRRLITYRITSKSDTGKIRSHLKDSMPPGLKRLKNGTAHRKDTNGIRNTPENVASESSRSVNDCVLYVEHHSQQRVMHKDSVQTTVSQSSEGIRDLTTLKKSVTSVEIHSHLTDMPNADFVQPFVVESIFQKSLGIEDCYDLTIEENHEFFAEGILVHNCWDSIRYACISEFRR